MRVEGQRTAPLRAQVVALVGWLVGWFETGVGRMRHKKWRKKVEGNGKETWLEGGEESEHLRMFIV